MKKGREQVSVAEKVSLEDILEDPIAKVMETLLENPILDYSKKQLAEVSRISRSTLYRIFPILEKAGIIVKTRKFQNTQLYKLNTESEIVNQIGRIKVKLEEGKRAKGVA